MTSFRLFWTVLLTAAAACLLAQPTWAAEPDARPGLVGRVLEDTLYGRSVDQTLPYRVYLPPGYGATTRRYPVLYMLHGAGGDHTEWTDSFLPERADELIVSGEIQPLIVVMPNGGDRTYWANWEPDGPRWGDYLAFDIVDEIDRRYRTIPARESRAVGGLSAGGYGALHTALRHADRFAVAGGHSPSVRTSPDPQLWFLQGQNFYAHDPLTLIQTRPEDVARLWIWVDVGVDDWWRPNIEALREALDESGAHSTYRVFSGTHEAEYWIAYLPEYLRFYAGALRGDSSTWTDYPR